MYVYVRIMQHNYVFMYVHTYIRMYIVLVYMCIMRFYCKCMYMLA